VLNASFDGTADAATAATNNAPVSVVVSVALEPAVA
jgi:hypothetical protein